MWEGPRWPGGHRVLSLAGAALAGRRLALLLRTGSSPGSKEGDATTVEGTPL